MGKKRITIIGDVEAEEALKKQRDIEREQKKLRESKSVTAIEEAVSSTPEKHEHKKREPETKPEKIHISGQKGGERVKSLESEMEAEAATVAKKLKEAEEAVQGQTAAKKIAAPRKRGKNYLSAKVKIDPTKIHPIGEAMELLRSMPTPKFTPTVELHINCVDKVNVTIELPYSTGKLRKAVAASDEIIKQIESGKTDFDMLFAAPNQMSQLAKLAKVLGPKGLMPNPKNGTVVADPEKAVKEFAKSAKISLKTEPRAPVLHTVIGKLNQKEDELVANYSAIIAAIKAQNITKVILKSTMSPAIKVKI